MSDNKQQDIEELLTQAGRRTRPSPEMEKEVFEAVHAQWKKVHRTPFYKKSYPLLIAASIAFFSFMSIYLFNLPEASEADYIQKLQIRGQVHTSDDRENWQLLAVNQSMNIGDYIRTDKDNRLLVKLDNGNILKLDENTEIQLLGRHQMALFEGAVYVDSDHATQNNALEIKTDAATIHHIGTQYSVRLLPNDQVTILVRSGQVAFATEAIASEINKGSEVVFSASEIVEKNTITTYDDKWIWTQQISEDFNIQDKNLVEYLNWVSEETGYPIHWENRADQNKSIGIVLSGSIRGLGALESLEVVMPTTRFGYDLSANQINITNRLQQ
ncbi:FecR domain-containing protein [Marinicella sp. W31]|uniref:FecR domain-containing protein n=1 Tax=Marinicella sp. W31 TaxID=3023713 RepID=UPI0037574E37